MDPTSNRQLSRDELKTWEVPITVQINLGVEVINAQVLNYHFKGACLKIQTGDKRILKENLTLDFYIGTKAIKKNIPFKVCWNNIEEDGVFGIQFKEFSYDFINRTKRFPTHPKYLPTLTSADPITAERKIFFNVLDISQSGMRISTSLTNRHLFVGMQLKKCELHVPGESPIVVDIQISRMRMDEVGNSIEIGVGVTSNIENYIQFVKKYICFLSPLQSSEDRLEVLFKEGFHLKKLKNGMSYHFVTTEKEYDKVLKLRLRGYGAHGKIAPNQSYKDMGEGLKNEGKILAAYLEKELIASVELRFGDSVPLRFITSEMCAALNLDSNKIVEVNKLVVHPSAQNTDTVVGMFQRLHSIVYTKGSYDIMLASTDKLKQFYTVIGAVDLNYKIPHPTLKNCHLNIMKISMAAYRDGEGVNPYSWDAIYLETNKLFEKIGILKNLNKNRKRKLLQKIAFFPIYFIGAKKRKFIKKPNKQGKSDTSHIQTPLKWSKQHIIASVMQPYILEADTFIGPENVNKILTKLKISREFISKNSNWTSVDFMNDFLEEYRNYGDISQLSYQAGLRSMKPDVVGFNYYMLKMLTAKQVFQAISKLSPKFNKTRTYKLLNITDTSAEIEIGLIHKDFTPKHKESCLNWKGSFESVILMVTGKKGEVKKQNCIYEGHSSCTYSLHWNNKKNHLFEVSLLAALNYLFYSFFSDYIYSEVFTKTQLTFAFFLFSLSILILQKNFSLIRKLKVLYNEFDHFRNQADDNYKELQEAKHITDVHAKEALLLEQTSHKIQVSKDLREMLNATLNEICTNFGFSRSFVMLADEKGEYLKTSAIAGLSNNADLLWKFSVDVRKMREGSIFLSSAFLSGFPIIIHDVKNNLNSYNLASQAILEKLESESFCIVPIPSQSKNWGILVADKKSKNDTISQRDLQLLERVALHLGIALDKKSSHDYDKRLRNYFEKFVPPQILQETLLSENPRLGGQQREAICMFVDIREFSKLSTEISPETSLNMLNDFFEILHKTTLNTGGYIDKFLGDGALVTWGARGQTKNLADHAIQSALDLLNETEAFSARIEAQGLPKIKIGIGIHIGNVIVGNVGANNRMESTVIGEVVNFASRLENLNKNLDSSIVLSEKTYETLSDQLKSHFNKKVNIEVRGWKTPVNVYFYQKEAQGESNDYIKEVA